MDTLLGRWKASEDDLKGLAEFGNATNASDTVNKFTKGFETEITKSGDCWVFSTYIDGELASKETMNLEGKYEQEIGGQKVPCNVSAQVQGSKVIIEGEMGGCQTKCVRYIKDGQFVTETHAFGSIKVAYCTRMN